MKKRVFYTEAAYPVGIIALALGTAFMEKADFGVSMVVAPAYLLYLKLNQVFPFVTFGMAEYMLQAFLLLMLCFTLRRFRVSYLFSFVTAVIYGFTLDGCMGLVALIGADTTILIRLVLYLSGMLVCAVGVSLLFHTYIAPEVYELAVKEISVKLGFNIVHVKTLYDCVSCLVAVLLSFAFFELWHFEGVKLGTIFCALVNGTIIGFFSRSFERFFDFRDGLKLRRYFA